jgi:hypothetical protein
VLDQPSIAFTARAIFTIHPFRPYVTGELTTTRSLAAISRKLGLETISPRSRLSTGSRWPIVGLGLLGTGALSLDFDVGIAPSARFPQVLLNLMVLRISALSPAAPQQRDPGIELHELAAVDARLVRF